ncbi:TatD family hydrolase [Paenibacillus sp. N3.4]|uniref:TatD family hydrolase n=1 Tax=Paenibacillus sp. N3.4 TaxID=2603222 RepID=UPI0011CA05CD|nr:TatD family hydrolase [Paenibacillus sp. N3.4]TXK71815.1 TatD family deoxyribonuclease [Paenibacillus sp. N3.4]
MIRGIDAHIHLDMYEKLEAITILEELSAYKVEAVIAVSRHLLSCKETKSLRDAYPDRVFAAYGYHPEQELPSESEASELLVWMKEQASSMIAVGEIGLPYYLRKEAEEEGKTFDLAPYILWLDRLLEAAAQWGKPVVLHAVYEDAELVCDLLGKHGITKAHFHWFKGSPETVERMIRSGFYVSVTPDILYEEEIQNLVRRYPMELLMVETDGPWPFEGPFENQQTHPQMIHEVIQQIAKLHELTIEEAARILVNNTKLFYDIMTVE